MPYGPELSTNKESLSENEPSVWLSLCKKIGKKALACGLAFTITASSMFLTGCGGEKNSENLPGPAYQTAEYEKDKNIFVSVTQLGEEKFIERYGSLYSDPEATYGALLDYEKVNNGASAFIEPGYVEFYRASVKQGEKNGEISGLGFENAKMSLTDMDLEKSMEFFDSYVKKQMDLCANYLSFNPGAREVIKDQFLTYCGQAIFEDDKFIGYEPESERFFGFIESYVSEFEQSSYFSIQPSTQDITTISGSFFSDFLFMREDKTNCQSYIAPVIKVSQYENGNAVDPFVIFPAGEGNSIPIILEQEQANGSTTNNISVGTTYIP